MEYSKPPYELARNELRLWAESHGENMDELKILDAKTESYKDDAGETAKVCLVKIDGVRLVVLARLWFAFGGDCRHIEIKDMRP